MQIKLLNLTLTNFKGIQSYHLDPRGVDTTIIGMNGTGKSTLFDAFTWLLFGKDSHGATKFLVKPRDSDGKEIEGAEPVVEADLDIDGQKVELRRELKENWVQHRGELERERKSDTTKLFIDRVPKKLKEYQEYINSLISEDLFKLLTVPGAFNTLPVAKQRDILMTMFPEVSDSEVIASDSQLGTLEKVLGGQDVDDKRKQIAYQRRELKKQVDGIPARIDEAERAKQQPQATKEQLLTMQAVYKQAIADLQTQINLAKATDGDVQRQQEISSVKVQISETRAKYNSGIEVQLSATREKLNEQQQAVFVLRSNVQRLETTVQHTTNNMQAAEERRKSLLEKYHAEKKVAFDDSALTCPTCHRPLPEDEANSIRKNFNVKHSDLLQDLISQGKTAKADAEKFQLDLESAQASYKEISDDLVRAEKQLQDLQDELKRKQDQTPAFEDSESYKSLKQMLDQLELGRDGSDKEALANLNHDLAEQTAGLDQTKSELQKFEQLKSQDARIAELKQEEADLKSKAQELEGQDYLLQKFTRAKSNLLEAKLNNLFEVVQFRLFDLQKDGTVVDTVKTTVDGIDYDSGLNTGARMRAGLDIINALDRKHDVLAPIFIDNAEGLTDVFETDAQQIRLKVTEDEYLKVEA